MLNIISFKMQKQKSKWLYNDKREWLRQVFSTFEYKTAIKKIHMFTAGGVSSLVELASKAVACHIPFEVVEHFPQPIPEQLQLRIAFWSFPENEEDIRWNWLFKESQIIFYWLISIMKTFVLIIKKKRSKLCYKYSVFRLNK